MEIGRTCCRWDATRTYTTLLLPCFHHYYGARLRDWRTGEGTNLRKKTNLLPLHHPWAAPLPLLLKTHAAHRAGRQAADGGRLMIATQTPATNEAN